MTLGIVFLEGDIQHQSRLYKTDAEGREICSAVVRERHGVLWLSEVWVAPEVRRAGLGGRLVRAVVRMHGHRVLYLSVSAYADQPLSDAQLARWYARFGFTPVGDEAPGLMVRQPTGRSTCPPLQARRRRRRTTAEHIEILRRTQRSLIGRIDLNDQVDGDHAGALTEAEGRIADLEEQVQRLAEQVRELVDQLSTATTTSASGAGTEVLTAPAAAPQG